MICLSSELKRTLITPGFSAAVISGALHLLWDSTQNTHCQFAETRERVIRDRNVGLLLIFWETQSNPKTLIKRTGHTAVHEDFSTAKSSVYAILCYVQHKSHRKILYGFFKHCKLKDKADYSYHQILSSTHLYHEFSSAEHKIAILILIFWRMLVRMFEHWSHQTVDSSHWLTL